MTSDIADFNTFKREKQVETAQKFFERYRGNERGHGWGDPKGVFFDKDKCKWMFRPGFLGWKWGPTTVEDWEAHLNGTMMLGVGPLMDDSTVWWGCIDVDKFGEFTHYDFDVMELVKKAKSVCSAFIPVKSKSGGLHLFLHFNRPVDAGVVQDGLKTFAARLGLAGCEVFPKQRKLLVAEGDAPSWLFMPDFGSRLIGTAHDMEFPLGHGVLNENGGEFLSDEHMIMFSRFTTDPAIFDKPDPKYARSKSTYQNTGRWNPETATIEETFNHGPPCLLQLARKGAPSFQHNFLFECSTFFRQKYSDNWEEVLQWVNVTVLNPPGSADKLKEIIRTTRDRGYNYRCKEEPICSHCLAKYCRTQRYGVGNKDDPDTARNFAVTVLNTYPATYFVGVEETRMRLTGDEFLNLNKFRAKCMDHLYDFPVNISQKEWIPLVQNLVKEAGVIEPSELYRKNVEQLEALEKYFDANIPYMVRSKGQEYLTGQIGDNVRIRIDEKKIYFKWKKLKFWLERGLNLRPTAIEKMREYVDTETEKLDRTASYGGWFRSSFAIKFEVFDEDTVRHWLYPDEPEGGN